MLTFFARAVGAARSGAPDRAVADIAVLKDLETAMADGDYAALAVDARIAQEAATAERVRFLRLNASEAGRALFDATGFADPMDRLREWVPGQEP